MREIKFRAWHKDTKKMYEVGYIKFNTNEVYIPDLDDGSTSYDPVWIIGSKVEVMQYTGLLDKNGTEIYEGDFVAGESILMSNMEVSRPDYDAKLLTKDFSHDGRVVGDQRYGRMIYRVVWDDTRCGFYPYCDIDCTMFPDSSEVIGNLYENPELFSKKSK